MLWHVKTPEASRHGFLTHSQLKVEGSVRWQKQRKGRPIDLEILQAKDTYASTNLSKSKTHKCEAKRGKQSPKGSPIKSAFPLMRRFNSLFLL